MDFDWGNIQKSYCHGDLTFENIMISNGNMYLLDFLDSFINSRIVDFAKIFQDVILGWSWRNKNYRPFITLMYMYDYMKERISDMELEASHRMLVLNMLRIIPYTNSQTCQLVESNLDFP